MERTQPHYSESIVWKHNEDGVASVFVYGFTVANSGIVLAFAEGRIERHDDSPHHIFIKRSKDNGATWSENRILVQSTEGQCWAQPTALVERVSGRIFLFFCLNCENNASHVFYITSTDDGLTWSEPVEITRLFSGNPYGWTLHMPGPGHGIQLESGRLLIQLWHRGAITVSDGDGTGKKIIPPRMRNYGNSVIYSDDSGKSWHIGGTVPFSQGWMNNESRLVELNSKEILLTARTAGEISQKRIQSKSSDGGLTWSIPVLDSSLPDAVACDAGMIKWAWKNKYDRRSLLYSHPACKDKRRYLTVRASFDDGKSWRYSRKLTEGASTYSDLAALPDGTVLCLFGKGATEYGDPSYVVCARFNSEWLACDQE